MYTLLKIAFRNIWRNKRRTFITIGAILISVAFSTILNSLQKGSWDNIVGSLVEYYFGYGQIHKDGYWEEKSINKAFVISPQMKEIAEEIPEVKNLIPRIESFCLASSDEKTKGSLIIGVDPVLEDELTHLSSRLIKGEYFKENVASVLVAEGLADYLKLSVGDTLVLVSQGYHGANAAGKYRISGLVTFGSPELNNQMVFLPLDQAQYFFDIQDMVTSLVVHTSEPDEIKNTLAQFSSKLEGEDLEFMDWEALMPELVEFRRFDEASGSIVRYVLYLIVSFGIFGTFLMMVKERQHEFGVLLSIGMKRKLLAFTTWMETIFLGMIGAIMGMVVSFPFVFYLYKNPIVFSGDYAKAFDKLGAEPIMPAALDISVFLHQAWIVFILVSIMSIYPIYKVYRLNPIEGMRG